MSEIDLGRFVAVSEQSSASSRESVDDRPFVVVDPQNLPDSARKRAEVLFEDEVRMVAGSDRESAQTASQPFVVNRRWSDD